MDTMGVSSGIPGIILQDLICNALTISKNILYLFSIMIMKNVVGLTLSPFQKAIRSPAMK